jgi:nucleoside recognition membrane protein YjiH
MGKSTISMAIFNSFLYVYQRLFFTMVSREMMGNIFENPWETLGFF